VTLDARRVAALLAKDAALATAADANGWLPLHYCAASALFAAGPRQAAAQATIARALLAAGADRTRRTRTRASGPSARSTTHAGTTTTPP
jgi:hypothetical protein